MSSPRDHDPSGRGEPETETCPDRPSPEGESTIQGGAAGARTFMRGQIVADRYRIVGSLGEGGMGEVWQAFDLKLRVDVALKTLRRSEADNERHLEALRREVRSARDVISPNVCRVFDLEIIEGQELVSMEYVDGETLIAVLRSRGSLEITEASEIASQMLAGLAAIHEAGLVHRDLKPENIMITRAGRVVIMDFGLAKLEADSLYGSVSGTPAYMAPEQRRGEPVDARADIFAVGIVLAEMLSTDPEKPVDSRRSLFKEIHQSPPSVPEGPWSPVIARAVAQDVDDRYRSAMALSRALEEVSLRVEGAEDKTPYPGLASFTENDAQYFFGREVEVESIWKKLQQPHLLALVGPSGAGKSSFLRAGLIAHKPEGWRHVICHPGDAPFRSLAKALVPELYGDTDAVEDLVQFGDPETAVRVMSRWRSKGQNALLIVDQFEELFTLNPAETQSEFASLLGRLPIEADVHVLLSMRDDFLFRCSEFPSLAPIFSELSPLRVLTRGSLRRALVQPALACGYRFEEESLVEEMTEEVADERGALPLLAFAASRLWERRDRERGMLTREAYEEIGGVAGALAQHAEATMDRLGEGRRDTVREIFRNLVTAEGTRAVREVDELLSVFEDREEARQVLAELIDARLLTTYEIGGIEDEDSTQRVEIVHESLLDAWPRLVRWRTQDEDSAQLRDQLRQAAKMWEERDRSEDLLWSGSAYFDYRAWRERYPGGLSDTEEAFAQAMVAKANRQRRRRRIAAGVLFAVLAIVLGVFGWLWRQSEKAGAASEVAREEAIEEARRSEANQLLALGRLEVDENPTGAVAYALASLELADSEAARRFVVEALWKGPTAFSLGAPIDRPFVSAFSPDGHWLVTGGLGGEIAIWSRAGGKARVVPAHQGAVYSIRFAPDSETFVTSGADWKVQTWSVRDGTPLDTIDDLSEAITSHQIELSPNGKRLFVFIRRSRDQTLVRVWSLENGELRSLDSSPGAVLKSGRAQPRIDPGGRELLFADEGDLVALELDSLDDPSPRIIGTHPSEIVSIGPFLGGGQVVSTDRDGGIRFWRLDSSSQTPLRSMDLPGSFERTTSKTVIDPSGSWLGANRVGSGTAALWRVDGPPDARPLLLRQPGGTLQVNDVTFDPTGNWYAVTDYRGVTLWPLTTSYPMVLVNPTGQSHGIAIAPDGSSVVGVDVSANSIYVFPLGGSTPGWTRPVGESLYGIPAFHPDSEHVAVGSGGAPGLVYLAPLAEDGEVKSFEGYTAGALAVAVSPDGSLIAAGGGMQRREEGVVRVWNVETREEVHVLDPGEYDAITTLFFLPDGRLVAAGGKGARVWNVDEEASEAISRWNASLGFAMPSGDGRKALLYGADSTSGNTGMMLYDFESKETRNVTQFGPGIMATLDRDGDRVASADFLGTVRVGSIDSGEPHLLLGHEGMIWGAYFTPDDRHLVSVDAGGTVRVWEVPEGQPFHTLPYDELLERLRALTNLRVVRSGEGYRLETQPFQGWAEVPTW